MTENVAVVGASPKPDRYSYKAVLLLSEKGHTVFPINPAQSDIAGIDCFRLLSEIHAPVHTVTLYVRPEISDTLENDIIEIRPRRVIFNPGTENPRLKELLEQKNIITIEACTLVLLRTGKF